MISPLDVVQAFGQSTINALPRHPSGCIDGEAAAELWLESVGTNTLWYQFCAALEMARSDREADDGDH